MSAMSALDEMLRTCLKGFLFRRNESIIQAEEGEEGDWTRTFVEQLCRLPAASGFAGHPSYPLHKRDSNHENNKASVAEAKVACKPSIKWALWLNTACGEAVTISSSFCPHPDSSSVRVTQKCP